MEEATKTPSVTLPLKEVKASVAQRGEIVQTGPVETVREQQREAT